MGRTENNRHVTSMNEICLYALCVACVMCCLYLCMSIVAPIALLTIPGMRDPPLCISSKDFFLALGVFSWVGGGWGGHKYLAC